MGTLACPVSAPKECRYTRAVSYGDAFGWAFRDPQWGRKLIVQGLIGLIPIVGQIALLGWVLQCLDHLRSGYPQLPEPGFPLGRGFSVFVPELVLGIIVGIIPQILNQVGNALNVSSISATGSASGAGVALIIVGGLLGIVLGLGAAFMSVALVATVYEGGMGAGFHYPAILRRAFQHPVASLLGIVASLIASVGGILCYIGVFLTYGYGYSIVAGLLTQFVGGGVPLAGGAAGYPGYGGQPSPYAPRPPYAPPPPGGYGQQPQAPSGAPPAAYPQAYPGTPPPQQYPPQAPQYPPPGQQYPQPGPPSYPPPAEPAPPATWPPPAPGNDQPPSGPGTPPPAPQQ